VRLTVLGNHQDWHWSQRSLRRCGTVSRSLIELQVRVHRRGAEDTEAAQRLDSRTLRLLCGLGASAVKWRLQNYDSPKIVTRTPRKRKINRESSQAENVLAKGDIFSGTTSLMVLR
jgi:hypothetical protein